MADAKINIGVQAKDAIQEIDKLNKALAKSQDSLAQLQKQNSRYNAGLSNANQIEIDAQAWGKIQSSLDKNIASMKLFRGEAKGTIDAEKWLSSYAEKMARNYNLSKEQLEELVSRTTSLKDASKGYREELQKGTKSTNNFGKKLLEIGKNILVFQTAIAVFRKTLTSIENIIKDSIKAAAEAEQVFSKLSTVFNGFSQTANKTAKQLADTIGVAVSTASSALSTVGDLLQAQGMGVAESLQKSTEWAEKFQDIIAFKDINMSLEEFAQNFMSGAAGNLRNFRTFGSIVKESAVQVELANQGLDKLTGSQLELAKMTIRAEMALAQQANAVGATKREWETMLSVNRRYTEATKQLKENLGSEINNFFKPMKKWLTEVISGWNELYEAKRKYTEEDFTVGVKYDESSSKDRRNLASLIDSYKMTVDTKGKNSAYYSITAESVSKISQATGASISQVLDMFEERVGKYNRQDYDRNLIFAEASENLRKVAEALEKQNETDSRRTELEKVYDNYNSFEETLASIVGANITPVTLSDYNGYVKSEGSALTYEEYVSKQYDDKIAEAMYNLVNATADSMGKTVEAELGEFDQGDLYKLQLESMKELYKTMRNQFLNNKDINMATGDRLTDEEKAQLQELISCIIDVNKALEDYNEESKKPEYVGKSMWDVLQSVSGAFSGVVTNLLNIKEGNDVTSGDWVMAIIQIAQQMDTFAPAFEHLDEVLDIIDAVLSPLKPLIEFMNTMGKQMLMSLFERLFPVIKIIAEAITLVYAVVETIRRFVSNIFTLVHNILQYIVHPISASRRDIWEYESITDVWTEAAQTLKEIEALTFEIKENTDETDISAYEEMYRRGLITLSEFNSLVSDAYGKNWDRVSTFDGGSYQNGSGGTTIVYSGDMHIVIDGTNLSAKEIADELERRSIAGNRTYA